MSRLANTKMPIEYDSVSLTRQFDRVQRALNLIEVEQGRQTKLFGNELSSVRKISEDVLASASIAHWMEWHERRDSQDVGYAIGKLAFASGWDGIAQIEYRYRHGANLDEDDAWTDMDATSSEIAFTEDSEGSGDYPQGGYYYFETPLVGYSRAEKKVVTHVQIRVRQSNGKVVLLVEQMFDADKLPDVYGLQLTTGSWNESAATWDIIASGFADLDSRSVAFATNVDSDLDDDVDLVDADFSNTTNLSGTNTRFDTVIGTAAADSTMYVVAKAWSSTNKSGFSGNPPFYRQSLLVPPAPFGIDAINNGDITAGMLAGAAQRVEIDVSIAHKGFATTTEDILTYSGSITYGDNTSYSLSSSELDAPTNDLYYIFFDPSINAGDTVVSNITTSLQITTDRDVAGAILGRRVVVGVYRRGSQDGEAAFFLSNSGEIAVTAPFVFAANLSSISADLGQITTGNVAVTATVEWGAVKGTTDAPDDNATWGSDWFSSLQNKPSRFNETPSATGLYLTPTYSGYWNNTTGAFKTYMDSSGNFHLDGTSGQQGLTWDAGTETLTIAGEITLLSNSDVDYTLVSGTKPPSDATKGATWGTDLTVPGRFSVDGTPSSTGLYMTATHLGYWDQTDTDWKAYIDNSGNFGLAGDADNAVTWNGSIFSIATTGEISVKHTTTGKTARIRNGIFWGTSTIGDCYLDGSGLTFNMGSFLYPTFIHYTSSTAYFKIGSSTTGVTFGQNSITGASGGFNLNPSGNLQFKGATWPSNSAGYLYNNGSGVLSWIP